MYYLNRRNLSLPVAFVATLSSLPFSSKTVLVQASFSSGSTFCCKWFKSREIFDRTINKRRFVQRVRARMVRTSINGGQQENRSISNESLTYKENDFDNWRNSLDYKRNVQTREYFENNISFDAAKFAVNEVMGRSMEKGQGSPVFRYARKHSNNEMDEMEGVG